MPCLCLMLLLFGEFQFVWNLKILVLHEVQCHFLGVYILLQKADWEYFLLSGYHFQTDPRPKEVELVDFFAVINRLKN